LRGQPPIPLAVDLKNPKFVGAMEFPYPDLDMRTPYMQNYHLTAQHEVVKNLALQVGYVGKLGRKLVWYRPKNPALYAPGATLANIDQRRIYPGFGNIRGADTLANSSYSALQVELNKRFSRGFSLQGAYTFSRAIDYSSSISLGNTPVPFNLRADRGLADYFAKHIFSFSWIWDLPKLASSPSWLRAIAGSWQVNGLVSARSGMPINILTGTDIALSGTSSQRPNVIGNPLLPSDRPRAEQILTWFDRTAFAQPATGAYGNVGRNALLGPGASTTNAGVFKNFSLPGREGLRLQFRSEFFSLLNSPNFGNPQTQVNAGANMGRITSASGNRVIQFALKLLF
jgi:hypothetical protein